MDEVGWTHALGFLSYERIARHFRMNVYEEILERKNTSIL